MKAPRWSPFGHVPLDARGSEAAALRSKAGKTSEAVAHLLCLDLLDASLLTGDVDERRLNLRAQRV
jgi:hypothetical protein